MKLLQCNKVATYALPAMLVLAVLAAGCSKQGDTAQKKSENKVPTVTVIRPQRGSVVRSVELPGDLVGWYEAALHAKVTGYLKSISVDKGDWVKKGQVLAVIEVPELRQNLARQQARLEVNRLTYERLRRVQKSDPRLVAEEDVDIARSKYLEAKAAVGELEAMLAYTKIIAPFDGVITGRFADPGALIKAGGANKGSTESSALISPSVSEGAGGHSEAGGPVVTIAKIDKLRCYVYVPEEEVGYIRKGTPAVLQFDEYPGRKFTGKVARFATALDLSTRTMLTEIDIDNPDHKLYPRMYAHVNLEIVRHQNVLRLPASAVSGEGKKAFVYVVEQGKLRKTPVVTGINNGKQVEIASGLKGDELVVNTIAKSLSNGETVHARTAQGKAVATETGEGSVASSE